MLYFEGLTDEAGIKARYKALVKENHPDRGGSTAVMAEINAQYEKVCEGAYQRAGKSITEIESLLAKDKAVAAAYFTIAGIEGLEIELCGNWLWVSGHTKAYKDVLKAAGFRWSQNKLRWYWRPLDYKRKWGKSFSLDEIRDRHGSYKMPGARRGALA